MKKLTVSIDVKKTRELTGDEIGRAAGGAMVVVKRGPAPGGTGDCVASRLFGTSFNVNVGSYTPTGY